MTAHETRKQLIAELATLKTLRMQVTAQEAVVEALQEQLSDQTHNYTPADYNAMAFLSVARGDGFIW